MDNKLNNKKILWLNIVSVFAVMIIYTIIGEIRPRVDDYIADRFITQLILLTLALIAAKITSKLYTLKFKTEGFGEGYKAGMVEVVYMLYILISAILKPVFYPELAPTASLPKIILFIIDMLMLGIGEETLFRGILLNGFSDYYGETSTALIRKGVIISGIAFGAVHLLNIVGNDSIIDPIIQALCDIPSGILYGAIYIRSKKNIWPIITIHAIFDLGGFIGRGVLTDSFVASSAVSCFTVSAIVFSIVELVVGLYILRDKKLNELIKK